MSLGSIFGISTEEFRKAAAWATTRPLPGLMALFHPSDAGLDELDNIIYRSEYGKANSPYGWDIDHRRPSALGGSDHHGNLRALKCSANRSLGGVLGQYLR
ncbi:hypothetical protein TomTYG45_07460 [Sphingobium sp. TomTYG45]